MLPILKELVPLFLFGIAKIDTFFENANYFSIFTILFTYLEQKFTFVPK